MVFAGIAEPIGFFDVHRLPTCQCEEIVRELAEIRIGTVTALA